MAVYTPVSDQELSDFLQNYDIGDVISLTEITEGVENSNFILKTRLDSYILTLYEKIQELLCVNSCFSEVCHQ